MDLVVLMMKCRCELCTVLVQAMYVICRVDERRVRELMRCRSERVKVLVIW